MFGDEPALEPDDRFHQSVLSDDAVEAIEAAERSVKEMVLLRCSKVLSMVCKDTASSRQGHGFPG
ncbi:hypothetical protein HYPDE_34728 [Hyphomicrobium denitrificans 1NES1]|uniref:Uncharacterized protein n=1 Tax=Hyphomicrobium denitrificans 1NES1 TaxID=670307 RepID=N0B8N3_9HYPH|nr:hypothetical protein HYPDE_34728 [Hyphomicrobium denitrificans 1NES1]